MKKTLIISLVAIITTVLISGFIIKASAEETSQPNSNTPHFGLGFGRISGSARHEKMLENSAKILGMTPEELQKEIKTLPEVIKEKGMSLEEFQKKMHEKKLNEVDELVKHGKISQDFANEIKERMENHFKQREKEGNSFHGFGRKTGNGPKFFFQQNCQSN